MRMLIAIAVFAVRFSSPVAAGAQTAARKKPAPPPVHTQRIDIDDPDEVWGENPAGQGDVILANTAARHLSLIKIRQDFKAEMMATAAGL